MIKILVMADSCGSGLKPMINRILEQKHPDIAAQVDVTVRSMGGAKIDNILERMDKYFPNNETFDLIFTFVGVNNLTVKNGKGKIEPVYEDLPKLINDITDKYTKLKIELKNRCAHIIISQIVGVDIDCYNKYYEEGRWYYQQTEINNAMPVLAHTINLFNLADGVHG